MPNSPVVIGLVDSMPCGTLSPSPGLNSPAVIGPDSTPSGTYAQCSGPNSPVVIDLSTPSGTTAPNPGPNSPPTIDPDSMPSGVSTQHPGPTSPSVIDIDSVLLDAPGKTFRMVPEVYINNPPFEAIRQRIREGADGGVIILLQGKPEPKQPNQVQRSGRTHCLRMLIWRPIRILL